MSLLSMTTLFTSNFEIVQIIIFAISCVARSNSHIALMFKHFWYNLGTTIRYNICTTSCLVYILENFVRKRHRHRRFKIAIISLHRINLTQQILFVYKTESTEIDTFQLLQSKVMILISWFVEQILIPSVRSLRTILKIRLS